MNISSSADKNNSSAPGGNTCTKDGGTCGVGGYCFACHQFAVVTQPPASPAPASAPIDMILHCPKCGMQHVDEPDERTEGWSNPAHRSHLCHGCDHIWRPADVPTNGVKAIQTRGKNDSPVVKRTPASAQEGQGGLTEIVGMAVASILHSHRLQHLADSDGQPYQLVDLLAGPEAATIKSGQEEVELIVTAICAEFDDIYAAHARQPATTMGSAQEGLTVERCADAILHLIHGTHDLNWFDNNDGEGFSNDQHEFQHLCEKLRAILSRQPATTMGSVVEGDEHQAHVMPPFAAPAGQQDAGTAVLLALRDGIQLEEPVSISKAVLAQQEARVSLSGGTGPVACAMLVNIQLTPWAEGPEKAEAFASGYNTAMKWYRSVLLELADKASADAASRCRAQGGNTSDEVSQPPADSARLGESVGEDERIPSEAETQAAEAKLYRDLTSDALELGYDGIPAALEEMRSRVNMMRKLGGEADTKPWRERLEEASGVQPAIHYAEAQITELRAKLAQARSVQQATQGMADCMDMVRQELIEAGVIDKSIAPMFIANAVLAELAQARAAGENAPWLTTAHMICMDEGIEPGHINDRLTKLRDLLDERRALVRAGHAHMMSKLGGDAESIRSDTEFVVLMSSYDTTSGAAKESCQAELAAFFDAKLAQARAADSRFDPMEHDDWDKLAELRNRLEIVTRLPYTVFQFAIDRINRLYKERDEARAAGSSVEGIDLDKLDPQALANAFTSAGLRVQWIGQGDKCRPTTVGSVELAEIAKAFDNIAASRRASGAVDGVRPIESAPKDGSDVIGWDGRRFFQMRWVAYRAGAEPCWHDRSANRWVVPKGWMPLPAMLAAAPSTTTEAAKGSKA